MNYLNSEDVQIVLKKYDAKFHSEENDFADLCFNYLEVQDATLFVCGEPGGTCNYVDLSRIDFQNQVATDLNNSDFKDMLKTAIEEEQTIYIDEFIDEDDYKYFLMEVFEELREEVENEK